ncbi:hypothetical protein [Aquimarina sp. 2201CG5-10]|uniref:hypothetical protein n=1 Tax=Aquimarina callyspongiae TaxID=3098150 RepID=UPI002AB4A83B|nr:hypothetical protein [Aquimarina sp. 2201CG5-10]MDY8137230.1 hypothetical protein [Aquimarina sp. 2201CG5-10]
MKKLLLFTFWISLLFITSCSKDDRSEEILSAQKEYLVKQTIIEFNKSAIKTGKYETFINSFSEKSASGELSQTEIELLIQEFLGNQTEEFLNVYYQLEALNLTAEEFYSIADQFEDLRIYLIGLSSNRSQRGCCDVSDADDGVLAILLGWACNCQETASGEGG